MATTYGVEPHRNGIVGDLFAMISDAGADRPHGLIDGAAIPGAPDVFGRGGGGPAIRR